MSPAARSHVMKQLTENTPLNQLRMIFSSEMGRIDQAGRQRSGPSGIELRGMEFDAVHRILNAAKELGVEAI